MAKKTLKNEGSTADVRPDHGTTEAAPTSVEVADEIADRDDNRLFNLYCSRIGSVDLDRIMTRKDGWSKRFEIELDRAKVALDVFNSTNER